MIGVPQARVTTETEPDWKRTFVRSFLLVVGVGLGLLQVAAIADVGGYLVVAAVVVVPLGVVHFGLGPSRDGLTHESRGDAGPTTDRWMPNQR